MPVTMTSSRFSEEAALPAFCAKAIGIATTPSARAMLRASGVLRVARLCAISSRRACEAWIALKDLIDGRSARIDGR